MKKNILFLCPYPKDVAPSQRLKFEQYYPFFEEEYKIEHSAFISLPFWNVIYKRGYFLHKVFYSITGYLRRIGDLLRVRKYDIVYVHLWVTPFGPSLFEWLVRKLAKKLVYDIDDLIYLREAKSKAHPIVNFIKGYKKPLFLMKNADHVITCTPYLDAFVRKHNVNTTDISSTVDTDRYQPINDYTNKDSITIGWSGSVTTSRFFLILKGVLQKIAAKYKVKVFVMGDPEIKIDGVDLEAVPWSEKVELENLQRFDIGVYPLPDEEWVYGKSGLKAIQYMALGVPTVATAIGANFRVIENGISGFLVKTDEEWYNALERLIENPQLRETLGKAGRERVELLYSIKANKDIYMKIFKSI
jgi:glycosyltransferase involved in cell wall biosynthesis